MPAKLMNDRAGALTESDKLTIAKLIAAAAGTKAEDLMAALAPQDDPATELRGDGRRGPLAPPPPDEPAEEEPEPQPRPRNRRPADDE